MSNTQTAKLQATRIERARATRRFYEIQPVKEGAKIAYYIVRNPQGELYQVSRTGCGCPDGVAMAEHGVQCKHAVMVREWFAEQKARQAAEREADRAEAIAAADREMEARREQIIARGKRIEEPVLYHDGEFTFRMYATRQAA